MNLILPAQDGRDAACRLMDRDAALLRAQQPGAALPLLELAASHPRAPVAARGLLAEALLESGRPREALAALEGGREGEEALSLVRARVHRALGQVVPALDAAAAAVIAAPRDAGARQILAACLSDAGRHDEAILLFGELAAEAPADTQRLAWLGTAFLRGRRFAAADELLADLCEARPMLAGMWMLRSESAFQQGEFARAEALATEGMAAAGPDPALLACRASARHRLGRRQEAQHDYAEASRLRPGDEYLAHLAAALGEGTGERAADGYVRQLFDQYAERFEASLIGLGYRVPGLVRRTLERLDPALGRGGRLGDVLDLGCGTGLVGVVLRDALGGRLVGVDLSPRMVEAARAKGVYDALHVAELGAQLRADESAYDLAIAADVFCYFGGLDEVITLAAARLRAGGRLLFTVERHDAGTGWSLGATARYRHSEACVRAALASAGLAEEVFEQEVLRHEAGEPVQGLLVCARKPGSVP